MRAPLQEGDFPFPGQVRLLRRRARRGGPARRSSAGRCSRCTRIRTASSRRPACCAPSPTACRPRRAVLAANMETALNALWDSGAGPGDRIVVVGAGVVGLPRRAISRRACRARRSRSSTSTCRARAIARSARLPPSASRSTRRARRTSSSTPARRAAGLACALACAGIEATVVEMSWYGDAHGRGAPRARLP